MLSNSTVNDTIQAANPEIWIFSVTRDFIDFNWGYKIEDSHEALLAAQSAPAKVYLVLIKEEIMHIYQLNPVTGSIEERNSLKLTETGPVPSFYMGQLAVSEGQQELYIAFQKQGGSNTDEMFVITIDINKWGTTLLKEVTTAHCNNEGTVFSIDTYSDSLDNEYLFLSGILGTVSTETAAPDEAKMFTMSLSNYYPTQTIDCYSQIEQSNAALP